MSAEYDVEQKLINAVQFATKAAASLANAMDAVAPALQRKLIKTALDELEQATDWASDMADEIK